MGMENLGFPYVQPEMGFALFFLPLFLHYTHPSRPCSSPVPRWHLENRKSLFTVSGRVEKSKTRSQSTQKWLEMQKTPETPSCCVLPTPGCLQDFEWAPLNPLTLGLGIYKSPQDSDPCLGNAV